MSSRRKLGTGTARLVTGVGSVQAPAGGVGRSHVATLLCCCLLAPGLQAQPELDDLLSGLEPPPDSAAQGADQDATPASEEEAPSASGQDSQDSASAARDADGRPRRPEDVEMIPVAEPDEPEPFPESPPQRRQLENIVVVAQKKVENIQDVPISISVIDDQFIEELSITDINTLTLYTPNVRVQDAGFFILPRIRGFGVDQNNKAFEPPAGVAIDGIPYTRLEYFTAALFDVGRMEVYRGPQGTAFGKNTTAGLLHLITKDPTDDFQGFLDVQYGKFDRRRIEGAVGGPLIEGFANFRIAGLSDERDGFVRNSAEESLDGAPRLSRGTERQGVRAKLDFLDLWGASLSLSAETVDIRSTGAGLELFNVSDRVREVMLRAEPNTDFIRGNNINTINAEDFRDTGLDIFNAELRFDIGSWGVVGLAGHSILNNSAALDTDGSGVDGIASSDKDRSPTTTGEIRLESPPLNGFFGLDSLFGADLGSSSFLAGLYYQRREIQGDGIVFRVGTRFVELFLAGQLDDSDAPGLLTGLLGPLIPLIPPVLNLIEQGNAEEVTQDFDQLARAGAVFGQFDWQLRPAWGLQLGVRLNRELKKASFNQQFTSPPPNLILPILGVETFERELGITENNVALKASLNFEPTEDIGIFLHWARGFRGGGFNAFSFRDRIDELMFSEEQATDWGLDIKTNLFDSRMRLNLSFFRTTVDDFQVLVGVQSESGFGLGGNQVENAAKARSQGVEADMTWLVFDWLTLFSTIGVADTEFLRFTNNTCAPDMPNTDGDDDPRCDVSGKPFPLTARLTGTSLATVTLPLNRSGLAMQIGGGFDYQTKQFTTTSLDDRFVQGDRMRWRATIGIGHAFQGWSFRVQGENLTDETVLIRQGQIIRGAQVEGNDPPRTIYGVFRYNF